MGRRRTHPGAIDKRGDSYRVRLMVAGELHTDSLKGCTRGQAEDFARQKHADLQQRADRAKYGLPCSTPFSELLVLYEKDELPTLAPVTIPTIALGGVGSWDHFRAGLAAGADAVAAANIFNYSEHSVYNAKAELHDQGINVRQPNLTVELDFLSSSGVSAA